MRKREQFGFMRANREKQRQVAAYGRLLDAISRDALGVKEQAPIWGGVGGKPFKPAWEPQSRNQMLATVHLNAMQQLADNKRFTSIARGKA